MNNLSSKAAVGYQFIRFLENIFLFQMPSNILIQTEPELIGCLRFFGKFNEILSVQFLLSKTF